MNFENLTSGIIDKMVNWTAYRQVSVEMKMKKGRNSPKYGYYMLLTIATPDVHDHLGDREVSTALFLPANIGSEAGELPRTLAVSQDSKCSVPHKKI